MAYTEREFRPTDKWGLNAGKTRWGREGERERETENTEITHSTQRQLPMHPPFGCTTHFAWLC